MDSLLTTACIICKREFDYRDVDICCDHGLRTDGKTGKSTGHVNGVCVHCCPDHGEVTKANHDREACILCASEHAAG